MKRAIGIQLCLIILAVTSTQAEIQLNVIETATNVPWTLSGTSVADSTELYDAHQLNFTGAASLAVESIRIVLDSSGTFDDSIAVDMNADGTLDFLSTQNDAYDTTGIGSGVYTPWKDASPYTLDATISTTGTEITAYWNGVEIQLTEGFNNASSFTLADWGFNADGTIPSDNFTTDAMRLGNINVSGPSGHDLSFSYSVFITEQTTGNITPILDVAPIPEPAALSLIAVFVTGLFITRRLFGTNEVDE